MRTLLATVWHTGTNYVRNRLKKSGDNVLMQHTGPELWFSLKQNRVTYNSLVTTYRDPYLVGASWGNRYDMHDPEYRWHWFTVWAGWERFMSMSPEVLEVESFDGPVVKSVGDTKGAYQMLNDDMGAYYELMPKDLIEFSIDIVERSYPQRKKPTEAG